MSDGPAIPDEVRAYADFLSSLKGDDRKRAEGMARLLIGNKSAPSELEIQAPVRSLGEYLDTPIEVPPMLVEPGVIVRGGLTAMTGRGGKGKTSVNLHRLVRWAAGKPMFEELPDFYAPTGPLKSLIVENEGAGGLFHEKVGLLINKGGLSDEDKRLARENLFIWGDGGWSDLQIDNDENLALLRKGIEEVKPDIVFLEPFSGLWSGEENSATDMRATLNRLIGVASAYGAGLMIAHHEKKNMESTEDAMSASRGSTVLEGAAAFMERFVPVQGGKYRELVVAKNRYRQAFGPTRIEWRPDNIGWYDYVPPSAGGEKIMELLSCFDPAYVNDIAQEAEESIDKVRRILNNLLEENPPRVKREAGHSDGRGSSGYAYFKVCRDDNGGGLPL